MGSRYVVRWKKGKVPLGPDDEKVVKSIMAELPKLGAYIKRIRGEEEMEWLRAGEMAFLLTAIALSRGQALREGMAEKFDPRIGVYNLTDPVWRETLGEVLCGVWAECYWKRKEWKGEKDDLAGGGSRFDSRQRGHSSEDP